jgi:hypothetical protein
MSGLAEVQARRIVKNMQRLRHEVEVFATHAKTLREASHSIDGRPLLQEADNLLRGLTNREPARFSGCYRPRWIAFPIALFSSAGYWRPTPRRTMGK